MLLTTNIPIFVLIVFIIATIFIILEIIYNTKGILAIIGALFETFGITLCFISAVPLLQTIILLIFSFIIILLFLLYKKDKEI